MTKPRAEQLIVISTFVLLASTVGGRLAEGHGGGEAAEQDYGKKIVGGFLAMFGASIIAEAAPELGALFAISIASYGFLKYGLPAINSHYPAKGKGKASVKQSAATPDQEARLV
jgi:hypothetical protein